MEKLKTVLATHYLAPLREGGSLPAVMDADDGARYVVKFVGAGQGPKALIAELVAGEIGRALGLNVPEMAFVELDPALGPAEPNPEIRDLLRASVGLNLGFRYLPQAFAYNPLLKPPPSSELASLIVWFDAYVTNVDRTARNVNLLLWEKELWLIDHGAALYFHHTWADYLKKSESPFPLIKDHTLLHYARGLAQADAAARARLTPAHLAEIVELVPEVWLEGEPHFAGAAEQRAAYLSYLVRRLETSDLFVQEAEHARALRV